MPIPHTTIDVPAMQRHIDLLAKSSQLLAQTVLDVGSEYESAILDDLSISPPRDTSTPKDWETPKQMRAYFATDGFGKGIPYRRTGSKPMGWRVEIDQQGNVTTVIIQNIWSAARYVFGNLIGSPAGTQQRMHTKTGWQLASPKVSKWFTELNDAIYKRYRERVKEARRR
jgi:hypothetical protein